MRLFVDIDDTLILWNKAKEDSSFLTRYSPNPAVIRFVRVFRQFHPGHEVIVWSLGGKDYAEKHAADYLPGMYDECRSKYPHIPSMGDVFLDDDPLPSYRHLTIHPDMLEVPLREAAEAINAYVGAAGDASVQPLGTVAVPLRLLQALRQALEGKA